jgi:hypothetical protein
VKIENRFAGIYSIIDTIVIQLGKNDSYSTIPTTSC